MEGEEEEGISGLTEAGYTKNEGYKNHLIDSTKNLLKGAALSSLISNCLDYFENDFKTALKDLSLLFNGYFQYNNEKQNDTPF